MVNAFSFCLYGPENPLYYEGMLQNVKLIAAFYPQWKVYVYASPDVTEDMLSKLRSCSSVVLRNTGVLGPVNMIHRFYAIDEEGVDTMIVRDADSRVHWKDRWAINQFLSHPQYVAHIIRDNKVHNVAMMGGLWGLRKSAGIHIHTEYAAFCASPRDNGAGHDQSFLADRVYPKILGRVLTHHSYGLVYAKEDGVEFPFSWTNEVFCGRPETMNTYIERPEPQQELRKKRASPFRLFISQ
jgi:hypothetical protein